MVEEVRVLDFVHSCVMYSDHNNFVSNPVTSVTEECPSQNMCAIPKQASQNKKYT